MRHQIWKADSLRLRHELMGHLDHTASSASGELDCDYVKIILVVMTMRYGCMPVGNYEIKLRRKTQWDVMRSQE